MVRLLILLLGFGGSVSAPASAQEAPRYKAIWEPVSYPADLSLNDVFFVSPDVGWVTGGVGSHQGGVLLHTRDGGNIWEIALEDPQSSEGAFFGLRFIDETHGWVWQLGDRLLRTTDGGESWTTRETGLPAMVNAFAFPRRDRAYAVGDHGMIYRYRVIPVAEDPQGAIEAPLMSGVQMQ